MAAALAAIQATVAIRAAARRPLGGAAFLETVEAMLGRPIAPGKRGPKPKPADGDRN